MWFCTFNKNNALKIKSYATMQCRHPSLSTKQHPVRSVSLAQTLFPSTNSSLHLRTPLSLSWCALANLRTDTQPQLVVRTATCIRTHICTRGILINGCSRLRAAAKGCHRVHPHDTRGRF